MFNERKLKAQLVLANVTVKELCEKLGINESTFYRKVQNDGSFSREQINTMIEVLKIKEPMEIFFADELA
jgi:transposase-like protein